MQMIVTDLDGTLLNNQKHLTTYTREVLIRAQKQGIKVILATGRNYYSLKDIYQALEMDKHQCGGIIGVNGLEYYDFCDQSYQKGAMISSEDATSLMRFFGRRLFDVQLMNDDKVYECIHPLLRTAKRIVMRLLHKNYGETFEGQYHTIPIKTTHTVDFSINKVGLIQLPCYFKIWKRTFLKRYGDRFVMVRVSFGWCEIMAKGVSKGAMLEQVAKKYNIPLEDIYVFGDGENDLSMLELVEHSYAPTNALDNVKKQAHYSCLSNNEDGVAHTIDGLL